MELLTVSTPPGLPQRLPAAPAPPAPGPPPWASDGDQPVQQEIKLGAVYGLTASKGQKPLCVPCPCRPKTFLTTQVASPLACTTLLWWFSRVPCVPLADGPPFETCLQPVHFSSHPLPPFRPFSFPPTWGSFLFGRDWLGRIRASRAR